MDQLTLVCQYVVNLERFFLLLDQDVLIELLHKLNVFQLPLVSNVHHWLASVYVYYGHGYGVVDWVE